MWQHLEGSRMTSRILVWVTATRQRWRSGFAVEGILNLFSWGQLWALGGERCAASRNRGVAENREDTRVHGEGQGRSRAQHAEPSGEAKVAAWERAGGEVGEDQESGSCRPVVASMSAGLGLGRSRWWF